MNKLIALSLLFSAGALAAVNLDVVVVTPHKKLEQRCSCNDAGVYSAQEGNMRIEARIEKNNESATVTAQVFEKDENNKEHLVMSPALNVVIGQVGQLAFTNEAEEVEALFTVLVTE